jgi:hypothetical protein
LKNKPELFSKRRLLRVELDMGAMQISNFFDNGEFQTATSVSETSIPLSNTAFRLFLTERFRVYSFIDDSKNSTKA